MSESGYLEDGGGSREGQTGEGRRSGRDAGGDGEGEDEDGSTGDESGSDDGDDSSTHASQVETETGMVARGAALRAGEVSEPGD